MSAAPSTTIRGRRRPGSSRGSTASRWMPNGRAAVLGTVGVGLLLGLWATALAVGILPEEDIPGPLGVGGALVELVQSEVFWQDLGVTSRSAVLGLLIAFVIALPLSIAVGFLWPVQAALDPVVQFLRFTPVVALIPVAVLLQGATSVMVTTLVAWGSLWPLLVQMINGVRGAPRTSLATARAFGLSPAAQVRWVIVPSAMPFVITGLRIGTSVALIVAIGVELLTGSPGLGNSIRLAQNSLNFDVMYALIVASGLVGVVLALLLTRVERYVLRWQPGQSGGA